jgi:hypothetical protein
MPPMCPPRRSNSAPQKSRILRDNKEARWRHQEELSSVQITPTQTSSTCTGTNFLSVCRISPTLGNKNMFEQSGIYPRQVKVGLNCDDKGRNTTLKSFSFDIEVEAKFGTTKTGTGQPATPAFLISYAWMADGPKWGGIKGELWNCEYSCIDSIYIANCFMQGLMTRLFATCNQSSKLRPISFH